MRFARISLACLAAVSLSAETGRDAWLRYAPLGTPVALPAVVVATGESKLIANAQQELIRGVRGMTGRILRIEHSASNEPAIILTTLADAAPWHISAKLEPDGFILKMVGRNIVIAAPNDRGVLYGTFALLRKIATGTPLGQLNEQQSPYAPIRWVNQWDNLDGTVERGYGGRSIFWDKLRVREDLTRVSEFGRLLASLGINGCSINNVNADARLLTPEFIPQIAKIAGALRPWGVQVAISIDLGSPEDIGGLNTFDPLDPRVAAWWTAKVDDIYRAIPDFGGLIMKADSEDRVGPSTYGRTHADAANVVARALTPHGGVIFYRGFVYDRHADWNNLKNDRARAAYDNFHSLDGRFDDNAIVQIKNGPIDFQVREPASPLFGGLQLTNQVIELQITQEYMGQASHTVFLPPMWKETLDFDMRVGGVATPVKALAAGKIFHRPTGGFVGVADVGIGENWMGNHLSQANLYGFGRLAWNPDLTSRQIVDEWTRLTFGGDPRVLRTIADIQLSSWRTYENYTGPLGLQTLTDITGNHYSVAVEASERNGWGQWHRADEKGVGMDRTVATGTGYIGQYSPAIAKVYESLATCPDDLLLFMHHVPYTHRLHSGKTVIQSIYDSHYEGADRAAQYVREWRSLKGLVDDQRFSEILRQLDYQAAQAEVWRDSVVGWFARESGITDVKTRPRHDRVEAESMTLDGYAVQDVKPWESASGGHAIACPLESCSASFRYDGPSGWRAIRVQYFDLNSGASRFRVYVGGQLVDAWTADDQLPVRKIDGGSSCRRIISDVALRRGDLIRIEGRPDGKDPAGLDYVEIMPK